MSYAQITCSDVPKRLYSAHDAIPSTSLLRELDYERYGTRHRSMMRYCNAVSGSLGFVISQDGAVRAITSVDDRLVMWDSIKLTYKEFASPAGKRKRKPEKVSEANGTRIT